ncbi:conserved protein, unknown function, partial [Hepatocystis sp. ex Piliocolobus tephrosceles]
LENLRKCNINEIAEIIKAHKQNKENNFSIFQASNETDNIKLLETFTKNQEICFLTCRKNLYERLDKDIANYKNLSKKNNLNFNENNIKQLKEDYKHTEKRLCFDICSRKYSHLLKEVDN